jgi:hypothetical protein
MADHKEIDPLTSCMETVQRLEEENDHLRKAAGAFGQLAERLNHTLREERRNGTERRHGGRAAEDRRRGSAP